VSVVIGRPRAEVEGHAKDVHSVHIQQG
jgi:hypothetical protein